MARKTRYLVEASRIDTRLVYVYAESAYEAKKLVEKAAKNNTLHFDTVSERGYRIVSKGDTHKTTKGRKVIDMPFNSYRKEL